MTDLLPLTLIPEYRDYVWGGTRLRPGELTAEAWVIYEHNRVEGGLLAGKTLAEICAQMPLELLGHKVVARNGARFPLLIKIIDSAQWLSLQVHPDDEQAVALEGPGFCGKTEAWHVLAAEPGASLISGLVPGTSPADLAQAVGSRRILDLVQRLHVKPGDTIYMPAGTLHALGPGVMIYEVQQSSDLTYRVYDWDRPVSSGRMLHIDKSLAVASLDLQVQPIPRPEIHDGQAVELCRSPFFTIELLFGEKRPLAATTSGESFHAITVIEGAAHLAASGYALELQRYQSVIIPAGLGEYTLQPAGAMQALLARVD